MALLRMPMASCMCATEARDGRCFDVSALRFLCARPYLQISGLEEKKRESIMVVANQTKSKLQLAEDALHRVQVGRQALLVP